MEGGELVVAREQRDQGREGVLRPGVQARQAVGGRLAHVVVRIGDRLQEQRDRAVAAARQSLDRAAAHARVGVRERGTERREEETRVEGVVALGERPGGLVPDVAVLVPEEARECAATLEALLGQRAGHEAQRVPGGEERVRLLRLAKRATEILQAFDEQRHDLRSHGGEQALDVVLDVVPRDVDARADRFTHHLGAVLQDPGAERDEVRGEGARGRAEISQHLHEGPLQPVVRRLVPEQRPHEHDVSSPHGLQRAEDLRHRALLRLRRAEAGPQDLGQQRERRGPRRSQGRARPPGELVAAAFLRGGQGPPHEVGQRDLACRMATPDLAHRDVTFVLAALPRAGDQRLEPGDGDGRLRGLAAPDEHGVGGRVAGLRGVPRALLRAGRFDADPQPVRGDAQDEEHEDGRDARGHATEDRRRFGRVA